ncbi:Fe(3+) ABC transporter substrate-binding protein [Albimonas sp. CAU 1670]|uniref:Fe(3+) ABC transporter substrate-binding protein n=1 Tax=Albimonas sp. CAU 1670 TaxID=3032599 RepID=UPI0023D9981B|nr:Fe(3+) ABC transporter substrate-binding protein [Albimonas sp. CAU 1670]MDF2232213.1 Fe(3+) ABC transporter substrate-binding protein [Albimonas sp. CAU 1670]
MPRLSPRLAALAGALALTAAAASAQEVNLYSSRHYDTDERLYTDFEKATGIKVNRIEAGADELIERMKAEGRNSPADVFLTTDAGRMWRAEEAGILAPVESEVLDARIPAHLRHPDDLWFGFSQRARIIFFDKQDVTEPPQTYAELADPKWKGKVCTRSGSNIYMLSLLASRIAHDGTDAATDWAKGLWENRARDPQGGDTDQLRAIVSGECDVVLANTYYFARALRTDVSGVTEHVDQIGWVFPDQDGTGAHMNVSAGAMAKYAPHPEAAKAFLEYLASDSAQQYFSAGNDEYPAVEGAKQAPSTEKLGAFKPDELNLAELGRNQAAAQMIYDSVGYE